MDDKRKGATLGTDPDTAAVAAEQAHAAVAAERVPAGETWEDAENTGEEQSGENDLILKFRKPYLFEGQEYTELDLSGLETVNGAMLSSVGRAVAKRSPGLNAASVEMTLDYAKMLAQRITQKPVEFFDRMPAKDAMTLKGIVVGFLFGGDGDN